MSLRRRLLNGLARALEGSGFDARFVEGSAIDTGPQAERARRIADRLNAVRDGLDKQPVVVWELPHHAAVTARGRFLYLSLPLVQRLSDDGLAFVLAHEMAHHDLGHVAHPLGAIAAVLQGPEAERRADAEALRIAHAAGFDVRGALEALDPGRYAREEDGGGWLSRWRKTHPEPEERLAAVRAWMRRRGLPDP